jgi:3-hydroxybutyryl-CoA dehydrogenase
MTTSSLPPLQGAPVLVVGAGIMGAGIAQVAAQAGHPVWLFDMREGAAAAACEQIGKTLAGLEAKGRIAAGQAQAAQARLQPLAALEQARGAALAIEAIVENLDAKRALFRQLEGLLDPQAVLATNTSSISVTAIARGLQAPQRLVGMHFFNPVPLMKLVEVVSGLQTDVIVAEAIFDLSRTWGKVPVHAKSTPGFIVNRIARPYYAETLALLLEQAAPPQVLDACLRAAGFRMGPCELMDLIGHDTNYAVTNSVYEANFFDKRFVPSLVQREMVDGGMLGRKSGQGFFRYPQGAPAVVASPTASIAGARAVAVYGDGPVAEALAAAAAAACAGQGAAFQRVVDGAWTGLDVDGARLVLSDGRCAAQLAAAQGVADLAVFDRPVVQPMPPGMALAWAPAPQASPRWREQAAAWLAALGFLPLEVADTPGLVVARTLAMLVNEAADAVLQGVCTVEGADAAMKLGVNYPAGPFEWLQAWGVERVVAVLEALDAHCRGERYRVSPWLRRHAAATTSGIAPK